MSVCLEGFQEGLQCADAQPARTLTALLWVAAPVLLAASLIHAVFFITDRPILPILELAWNIFVWIMPSRVLFALKPQLGVSRLNRHNALQLPSEHAAKSEILRDVLRMSTITNVLPKKTASFAPAGLGNWDNSCYQNSVLQALASLAAMEELFQRVARLADGTLEEHTSLAALQKLLYNLNGESNRGLTIWTPTELKSMSSWQQQDAQEYFSKLMDGVEKDVMTALKASASRSDQSSSLIVHDVKERKGDCQLRDAFQNPRDLTGQNLRPMPLDGMLAQRVGCTRCGFVEGLSMIPFNCLTLPLGRGWSFDLSDCLNEFTALEKIEGVECAKCTLLQAKHVLQQEAEQSHSHNEDPNAVPTPLARQRLIADKLAMVTEALQAGDFSDNTLTQKCGITSIERAHSTKTRQVALMRTPKCLVIHINRSLFDESTGAQHKNYADVQYATSLDLSPWCVGRKVKIEFGENAQPVEEWEMDPAKSLTGSSNEYFHSPNTRRYQLQAAIVHQGRHENGHYVCYRTIPDTMDNFRASEKEEQWWRMSDETVTAVSEDEATAQGGVFMLFYERENESSQRSTSFAGTQAPAIATDTTNPVNMSFDAPVEGQSQDKEQAHVATEERTVLVEDEAKAVSAIPPFSDAPQLVDVQPSRETTSLAIDSLPLAGQTSRDHDVANLKESEQLSILAKQTYPPTMRTAGLRRLSSEDTDHFKTAPMIATT